MITTLTGENSYALQQKLHELNHEFLAKHGDMAVERIDGEEADEQRITGSLQGLSLFAEHKMVVLKRPGAQKFFSEKFANLAKQVPDTTELVIVEPKLDKRTAYYKNLKSHTNFIQFEPLDSAALAKWIVAEASKQQGKISQSDASYLIERVGADQQLVANELEKLLNYNHTISRDSINLLTVRTPQSTVFEMLDAAFAGNSKHALELYHEQRQQKMEPLAILGMLAWQMHVLAVIATAGDKSANQIASDAWINPYVVSKSQSVAGRLGRARLQQLIHELLELDIRLKSETLNADDALTQFIIDLAE